MKTNYSISSVLPNINRAESFGPTWFIRSAALILFITGIAKVLAACGSAKLLVESDPIIGLSFGQLILAVGVLEIVVALIYAFGQRLRMSLSLVAWLSTNFLFYRIGLQWVGWHKPCSCLGNLTDALHIKPETADAIMKIVLGYLLIGSYGSIFWLWRRGRKGPHVPPPESVDSQGQTALQ